VLLADAWKMDTTVFPAAVRAAPKKKALQTFAVRRAAPSLLGPDCCRAGPRYNCVQHDHRITAALAARQVF
jgi:hypothetical protein